MPNSTHSNPIFRRPRIGIAGGSEAEEDLQSFCRALAKCIVETTEAKIVTGGLKRKYRSTLPAAEGLINETVRQLTGRAAEDRLEILLPDKDDYEKEELEYDADDQCARRLPGYTRRARRFAFASQVDVFVTLKGGDSTLQVIEVALAQGKPILPLPFTGGESSKIWEDRWAVERIESDFGSEALRLRHETLSRQSYQALASRVVGCIQRQLLRRCFIMMPYRDKKIDRLYIEVVEASLGECGFKANRVDQQPFMGDIIAKIRESVQTCDFGLAVITGRNPNVMFELGIAYSMNKPVLLLDQKRSRVSLPFDIQQLKVIDYDATGKDWSNLRHQLTDTIRGMRRLAL